MGLSDCKLGNSFFTQKGVAALPDTPSANGMTAAELKAAFDDLSKNYVGKSLNELIDILLSAAGAGEIGASVSGVNGSNVQAVLEELLAAINSADGSLNGHMADESNPHGVTADQAGAVSTGALSAEVVDDEAKVPTAKAVYDELVAVKAHLVSRSNPHGVYPEQIGAVAADALTANVIDDETKVPTFKAVYAAIASIGGSGGGGGDMFKAVYDSTNKATDIFAYADNASSAAEAGAKSYADSKVGTHAADGNAHSSLFAAKAVRKTYSGVISTEWSGTAPYTQSVTVNGILAADMPHIAPIFSTSAAAALLEKEAWNKISYALTGADTITFYCLEEAPAQAINIQIEVVR